MEDLSQQLAQYAYNITGSYEEAKDIVQDVFVEMTKNQERPLQNVKAYLTRSVINRAINRKKKLDRTQPLLHGNGIPEPVADEKADSLSEQEDFLRRSLLLLFEKLDPRQRAVFILKEAFEYDHDEIAGLLNISTENSRKLLSRARKELRENEVAGSRTVPVAILESYTKIFRERDIPGLEQLLAEEVRLVSGDNEKAIATIRMIACKRALVKLLLGIQRTIYRPLRWVPEAITQAPLWSYHGKNLIRCQDFNFGDDPITSIFFRNNPNRTNTTR